MSFTVKLDRFDVLWEDEISRANHDFEWGLSAEKACRIAGLIILVGGLIASSFLIAYGVKQSFPYGIKGGVVGLILFPLASKLIFSTGAHLKESYFTKTEILRKGKHVVFIQKFQQANSWEELSQMWTYRPHVIVYSKLMDEESAYKADREIAEYRKLAAEIEFCGEKLKRTEGLKSKKAEMEKNFHTTKKTLSLANFPMM